MRVVDGKFSIHEDEIIKTSNGEKIPHDEPVIIFRARDYLALHALRAYRAIGIADNCNDYHLNGIDERIARFEEFKKNNPEKMKQPGITRGI